MRILIADDHELFRRGLHGALQEHFPEAEIGEAKDEQQALDFLRVWFGYEAYAQYCHESVE